MQKLVTKNSQRVAHYTSVVINPARFFGSFAHDDSSDHRGKAFLVLAANGFELQTHTYALRNEADSGARPYFSILYKKVKLDCGINRAYFLGLNEEATYTQVLYPGSVFGSPTLP